MKDVLCLDVRAELLGIFIVGNFEHIPGNQISIGAKKFLDIITINRSSSIETKDARYRLQLAQVMPTYGVQYSSQSVHHLNWAFHCLMVSSGKSIEIGFSVLITWSSWLMLSWCNTG